MSARLSVSAVFASVTLTLLLSACGSGSNLPYDQLPPNTWVKISHSTENWSRQAHAGIAYDSKRATLLVFGSNTHGNNWDNSVHEFDPEARSWKTHAPSSDKSTYRADDRGRAIAGDQALRPWAMHTFDNITYDPTLDALIVSGRPEHNPIRKKTPDITDHPTWIYSLQEHTWRMLDNDGQPSPSFFAGSSEYDPDRDTLVAYRRGIWELGPERRAWRQITKQTQHKIHHTMVYDTQRHNFAVFGNHGNTNVVWIYTAATGDHPEGQWRKFEPEGDTVPEDQHLPVAFDEQNQVFLLVADNGGRMKGDNGKWKNIAATAGQSFIFNPDNNTYQRLPNADLPPQGMNYMMVYDRKRNVFLLISGHENEPVSIHALRLEPSLL